MIDLGVPLWSFATVWAFLAFNIMTPGPNVLTTIALAIGSGRRAGLASAAGVGLGISIWCLVMSLGFTALLQRIPALGLAMTAVACSLLILFAWKFIRAGLAARRQGHRITRQDGVSSRGAFLRALAVNATNPKALTSWIAALALFPVAEARGPDIAILTLGTCAIAFGIHGIYALVFSGDTAMRAWKKAAPFINIAVGVFFLAFALRLGLSSFG